MRKIRYFYWLAQSFVKKHFIVIIVAAIFGAASFNQSSKIINLIPRPKPTKHIGLISFDSTLSNMPKNIQQLVSSGLTLTDESGTYQKALSDSWQILDQGKTYVFSLQEDLTWQDGTPLTSKDINYSFKDVQIETPDDKTITFRLKEPFSPFLGFVSQPIFKRSQNPILNLFNKSNIVGTGDYRITTLKFNGSYLKQVDLESSREKRVYRFYNTEKAALTAFKLAEIDIIEDISEPRDLIDWKSVQVSKTLDTAKFSAVFFNVNDPNLSDKSIRQALTYAIPNKSTDETRAISPISPQSWAYNPKVKTYDYSLKTAQDLMSDFNSDFELELATTPTYSQLAEVIKASWEELGITVKIKIVNFPDTNNFQALLIGQQIPSDPDQYILWHSTQSTNITGYQNAKVDKLLEEGRKELDQQKRKQIYLDFQRFLVEDTPAAFLFHLNSHTISRK